MKEKKIKKRKEINNIRRERNEKLALKEQELQKKNDPSELSREAIEARELFNQQN